MKFEELSTIQEKVEYILKTRPDTRSSDALLLERYMFAFHKIISFSEASRSGVPQCESITRARRHLQSLGLYAPIEEVEGYRMENQVTFNEFYGG